MVCCDPFILQPLSAWPAAAPENIQLGSQSYNENTTKGHCRLVVPSRCGRYNSAGITKTITISLPYEED